MIGFFYRTAFFTILFSVVMGGKNWVFPYGVEASFLSVREHRAAQFPGKNHFAFHSLNRDH